MNNFLQNLELRANRTMKASPFTALFLSLLFLLGSVSGWTQTAPEEETFSRGIFSLSLEAGYDQPLFSTPYQELRYRGNRYLGIDADIRLPANFGLRLGYANIVTNPRILIPDVVFFDTLPSPTIKQSLQLNRQYVGFGPSYTIDLGSPRFTLLVAPTAGYSWLSGGDALVESTQPTNDLLTETLLLNTGFEAGVWSGKIDLELNYYLTDNLSLGLGFYYLRHFGVPFDQDLDLNGVGAVTIAHGENGFVHTPNPYTLSADPPMIVPIERDKPKCLDLASAGVNVSLRYTFGSVPKEEGCDVCACPNDQHRVVVTVIDEPTQQIIPGADVAIKDIAGNIVATGTTNSFGVADFGQIAHGNYTVSGLVYEVETTVATLMDEEFRPGAVIQKQVFYNDLRFILRGRTVQKGPQTPEPNVIVSLTNERTGGVQQDNSDGRGEFVFRLEPNSDYKVVGKKENKLSDIERASTMGLVRSTTLFVDLELGVENFDCGRGTILDIKYPFDEAVLTPESRFELDRLVHYLLDHPQARVELSSHTDSRGSDSYNFDLSDRRARSAVDYIISKGVPARRIIAQGYGESRLLNRCADGVPCSEAEHRLNRRTEAKLLCN